MRVRGTNEPPAADVRRLNSEGRGGGKYFRKIFRPHTTRYATLPRPSLNPRESDTTVKCVLDSLKSRLKKSVVTSALHLQSS